MSPHFDTGKTPCALHEPDVLMCSCGYLRQDVYDRIKEERRQKELNQRRKRHAFKG